MKQYFGTDGIRGIFGGEVINPEFVLKLGWAAGQVLKEQFPGKVTVLIGKDTRISGYLLESCLEAGLASSGADVLMLGPIPTPAVAYLTRTFKAQAGIVISASHNPYYDNGIKFFNREGQKFSEDLELSIENYLTQDFRLVTAKHLGKVRRINDARGRYIEFCKGTLGLNYSLSGFKIVVDCANGATYRVAPNILEELGAEVISLATTPDGFNINQSCGSVDLQLVVNRVLKEGADLGIAFDGDGDRVIMVDHLGNKVDGDSILYILAKFYQEQGLLNCGVVGTTMSSLALEDTLSSLGLTLKRAAVGDRYVQEFLKQQNWILGGESSGHIIHLGLTTTGDGIIAALQVLKVMKSLERNLEELTRGMLKYPKIMKNYRVEDLHSIVTHPKYKQLLRELEKIAQRHGLRVVVRPSGTEPILRVMAEGENEAVMEELIKQTSDTLQCIDKTE